MTKNAGEEVFIIVSGYWKKAQLLKKNDYGVCLVEIGTGEWFLRDEEDLKLTEEMSVEDWRNYGGYGKKVKESKLKSKV